jgi:hypothetical protein
MTRSGGARLLRARALARDRGVRRRRGLRRRDAGGSLPLRPGRHRRDAADRAGDADPDRPAAADPARRPSGAQPIPGCSRARSSTPSSAVDVPAAHRPGHHRRHQPRAAAAAEGDEPGSTRATPRAGRARARRHRPPPSRSTRSSSTATPPTSRRPPAWRWRRSCSAPRASTSTLRAPLPRPPRRRRRADPGRRPRPARWPRRGRLQPAGRRWSAHGRRRPGPAREHLIGLFAAVGNDDPRVLRGRQNLASALF